MKKGTKVFIIQRVTANRNHSKLEKQKSSKVEKGKAKFKLPVIVYNGYKFEDTAVKIMITRVNNDLDFKLNNVYNIHPNLLSIPSEQTWNIVFNAMDK